MRPLTHTMTIDIADQEVKVEITFTYTAGSPATGPSYSSGGEPATGAEVDVIRAVALIDVGSATHRYDVPGWMVSILQDAEHVIDALIEAAEEEIADAEAYADEMRADQRREEEAA